MTGKVRIIGGRWKRRLVRFGGASCIRPTPDRVRETLFNWLAPHLEGAVCLDLFAGSGILGFEAASRGASRVTMVERDREAVAALERQVADLGCEQVEIVQDDALGWLRRRGGPYDIVFVDPPYRVPAAAAACAALEDGGWLAAGARIYLETERRSGPPALPPGWHLLREKKAGQVRYHLALREGPPDGPDMSFRND